MLTQADEASTKTDRAGAKEKVQLEIAGSYGTDGKLDLEELNDNLLNIPGIKKHIKDGEDTELTKDNQIEGLPAEVEIDGYIFEISDEGVVTDKGKASVTTPQPEIEEVKAGEIVKENNKKYTDKNNKTAIIPVGFAVSEKEDEQVIDEGLVIKDEAGNEFVWIPVTGKYEATTNYVDTNVSANLQNDLGYLPLTNAEIGIGDSTEDEQKRELTLEKETNLVTTDLIEKYGVGGFYISRYEAGDGSVQANRTSATEGKLVSKKDAYVYNYISQEDAKEKAKEFTEDGNANVKSGLCTGIQWDMVMAFVDRKNDGGDPSQEFNVTTSSSSRHRSGVEQSGQNLADKVCNIYDLEGNCNEYVAEKNTYNTGSPYVFRGGSYNYDFSASHRSCSLGWAFIDDSFRFVLYIM